jgi:hypothetical protein
VCLCPEFQLIVVLRLGNVRLLRIRPFWNNHRLLVFVISMVKLHSETVFLLPSMFAHFKSQRHYTSLQFVGLTTLWAVHCIVHILVPMSRLPFSLIMSCLEQIEIIINMINIFCMAIFLDFGTVLQSTDCSSNLVLEYLAVLHNCI